MGADATVYDEIDPSVTTEYVGYDKLETASTVTVLTTETEIVEALSDGEIGTIIVEETPFYATTISVSEVSTVTVDAVSNLSYPTNSVVTEGSISS